MSGDYLYNSLEHFLKSPMWSGDKAHAQIPQKKWFGWVYISEFNSFELQQYLKPVNVPNLKFKIGYTLNIAQRKTELEASYKTASNKQNSSTIIYSWSLPRPFTFETKIKQFLKAFIHKDSLEKDTSGRSEIIHGLTLEPLIHIIQLCILETCLQQGFVNYDGANNGALLKVQLHSEMRSSPDIIKYQQQRYSGRMISKNVVNIFNLDKVWTFLGSNITKYPVTFLTGNNEESQFVQWVFNNNEFRPNEKDTRISNPTLEDSDTIAQDTISQAPSESNIDHPFFVGECVFTQYKKTYSPCRIIGYGTGNRTGQYVIEWLQHTTNMTFPVETNGHYKVWLNIAGKRPRHEYKLPKNVLSWYAQMRSQLAPDKKKWPTHADRQNPNLIDERRQRANVWKEEEEAAEAEKEAEEEEKEAEEEEEEEEEEEAEEKKEEEEEEEAEEKKKRKKKRKKRKKRKKEAEEKKVKKKDRKKHPTATTPVGERVTMKSNTYTLRQLTNDKKNWKLNTLQGRRYDNGKGYPFNKLTIVRR